MSSPFSSPPKRPTDDNESASSDRDTRAEKLAKGPSGNAVTAYDQTIAGIQDDTLKEAMTCINGVAKVLEDDSAGRGEVIFNSEGLGGAVKRLVTAVQSHPDKYPVDTAHSTTELLPAVDTIRLYQDDVHRRISTGIINSLQDPLWELNEDGTNPILQVYGMRVDIGGSVATNGRAVSPVTLTLADGDGLLINARVATPRTNDALALRKGYLIELMEFHRIHMAQHSENYSTAGIGIVRFSVIGNGPVVETIRYAAAERISISNLLDQAASTSNGDDSVDIPDPLEGFEEGMEPPQVPETRCMRRNRMCSRYGTHFFSKCVCEECPPDRKVLEELADVYFAANKPVAEMSNSEKRNMLYWSYATDIYHVHGWLNRLPLPPCLVFEIRKLYPNKLNTPYKEFQPSNMVLQ
jgi:hypothetical protein